MYPSDYLYATAGGSRTSINICLEKPMKMWDNSNIVGSDCKNNDWLKPATGWRWTLSPSTDLEWSGGVFAVSSSGNVNLNLACGSDGVRPVVFLKSTTKITGGEGTLRNPYILG